MIFDINKMTLFDARVLAEPGTHGGKWCQEPHEIIE